MSVHAAAVLTALLVVLAGAGGGGSPLAAQSTGYGIASDSTIETPTETVQLGGEPVDVSATSPHDGYEPLNRTVTTPTGASVTVELFDADGDWRTTVTPASDGTVSIPTAPLSSGTYYLVVREEGVVRAVERVVLSRHDVTLSPTESATTADELNLRIGVIPGGDIPYHGVEVVATDGTHESVTTATEVRLGLYEATVDLRTLPPGEYAVYTRLVGRPGPYVGMSAATTVTVEGAREEAGQSVTTETATAVATEESAATDDESEPGATRTTFPERGVVFGLALLFVGGLVHRLRGRR